MVLINVLPTTKIRIHANDARLVSVDGKGTQIHAHPTLDQETWEQGLKKTTVIKGK
tara:strand:- start:367 stop:534 length:168 start_codon:yes stop_codon:yes gene_type:complete